MKITYDREMFFKDAPLTADKEVLIETNKDDFYDNDGRSI